MLSEKQRKSLVKVVNRNPNILGGEAVFAGTRVPIQALIDYIIAGRTVDRFLHGFPSVSREQAETIIRSGIGLIIEEN